MSYSQSIFESCVSTFYAEEPLTLEIALRKGAEAVWAYDYDVEVCVYTSQLSPRLWVCDYSAGFTPEALRKESAPGGKVTKGRDVFWLSLQPEFLHMLNAGSVLTLGIVYRGKSFEASNVIRTRRLESIRLM